MNTIATPPTTLRPAAPDAAAPAGCILCGALPDYIGLLPTYPGQSKARMLGYVLCGQHALNAQTFRQIKAVIYRWIAEGN